MSAPGFAAKLADPPDPSPPVPGLLLLMNPASRVPRGAVKGAPIFSPWPGTNWQLTPSARLASEQGRSTMVPRLGSTPGKVRNAAALVPEAAKPLNCVVAYQPPVVFCWALLSNRS